MLVLIKVLFWLSLCLILLRKNSKIVEFYEKIYYRSNYIEGLGFLLGSQKNSKTYKIEKAILQQLKNKEQYNES